MTGIIDTAVGTPPTTRAAADEETMVAAFRRQVATQPGRPALMHRVDGRWHAITWREYADTARRLAAYLVSQGVGEGADGHVAIWGGNRPEWLVTSTAVLSARGRPVPVYQSSSADQAGYVMSHSESVVAVVETPALLARVIEVRGRLPALRRVVVMEGDVPTSAADLAVTWRRALELGGAVLPTLDDELERRTRSVTPDDVASLIYTSGTTGAPKAVIATHRNFGAAARTLGPLLDARPDDVLLSYLPLAHVVERINSEVRADIFGGTVWFCSDLHDFADRLREVRPTFLFGVPRVFEKMADAVRQTVAETTPPRRTLARWAMDVGRRALDRRETGRPVGVLLGAELRLADRLVLARIRETLGVDRARTIISGAAPISVDVLRFFHSLGVVVREGYGLTENMATTTINRRGKERLGTVGPVVPGVEVRLADDGEVLMRGPTVFAGYYRDPVATAEAVVDGWLHTGDVGDVDDDGFLRITDRKKDLIITAGGKNIAPTNIETALTAHPLVASAVVVGDRRPFVTALLTLDPVAAEQLVRRRAALGETADAVDSPSVRAEVDRHMKAVNQTLAGVEQVKRWTILPRGFAVGEELTPTFKVRRKVVAQRYAAEIEAMYSAPRQA